MYMSKLLTIGCIICMSIDCLYSSPVISSGTLVEKNDSRSVEQARAKKYSFKAIEDGERWRIELVLEVKDAKNLVNILWDESYSLEPHKIVAGSDGENFYVYNDRELAIKELERNPILNHPYKIRGSATHGEGNVPIQVDNKIITLWYLFCSSDYFSSKNGNVDKILPLAPVALHPLLPAPNLEGFETSAEVELVQLENKRYFPKFISTEFPDCVIQVKDGVSDSDFQKVNLGNPLNISFEYLTKLHDQSKPKVIRSMHIQCDNLMAETNLGLGADSYAFIPKLYGNSVFTEISNTGEFNPKGMIAARKGWPLKDIQPLVLFTSNE